MNIEFEIPGVPQQQGSKRYVGNGISIEANRNLMPWRVVALNRAEIALKDAGYLYGFTGPVWVIADFYFTRPKAHYRANGELRDAAPRHHSSTPDLDKLLRALGDVLTQSAIIRDDRLISSWRAGKWYAEKPYTDVRVEALDKTGAA